jgi:benzoyl-CoA-dihydrodiol lyase
LTTFWLSTKRSGQIAKPGWFAKFFCRWPRVLRRLDLTAKSFFSIIEPGSCFAGNLFELLLASDRSYMLNNADETVEVALSELNTGAIPMSNGLTRLQSRFLGRAEKSLRSICSRRPFDHRSSAKQPDW